VTRTLLVVSLLFVAAPAGAQPKGEVFAPKEGHYKVRFPGKPKEETKTVESAIGDLKVSTATYALTDGSVYMASYTVFPDGAAKPEDRRTLFDGARDGLKGKDGKVLSDKDAEVGPDKLPGRDVEIEKDKKRMKFRFVLRDGRLYQIAVIGSATFIASKEATAFFDSFELTK
jgi:hypothetical protein